MAKKIKCQNCKLDVVEGTEICPFCGEKVATEQVEKTKVVEDEAETKKGFKNLPKFFKTFLLSACIALIISLALILPASLTAAGSIYRYAFSPSSITNSDGAVTIVFNDALIVFVFFIIGLLNLAAVLYSILKKTTEINLFLGFSAFYFVIIAILSFLSPVLLSVGLDATQFSFGIGFLIVGLIAAAVATLCIISMVQHNKFLIEKPTKITKTN